MENLFNPPKFVKLDFDEIDHSVPHGNAFALMGIFQNQAESEGWPEEEIQGVLTECRTANYDHLVETLKAHCQ